MFNRSMPGALDRPSDRTSRAGNGQKCPAQGPAGAPGGFPFLRPAMAALGITQACSSLEVILLEEVSSPH